MIPFLCEALPDPGSYQSAGWLCMALAGICVSINQVMKVVDRVRGEKPMPPYHQQFADKVYTERRFEELEDKLEHLRETEREHYEALLRAGEERGNAINKRIDNLPPAIIALLKNTKGLL